MIESIYSIRSFSGCLRKGFGYIFNNPWLITRVMGPWAIAVAIFSVLYLAYILKGENALLTQGVTDTSSIWVSTLLYIAACIATHFFIARLFVFFQRNQARIEREEATRKLNEGEEATIIKAKRLTIKEQLKSLFHMILCMLPYTVWSLIFAYIFTNFSMMMMIDSLRLKSITMLAILGIVTLLVIIAACIFLPPLFYTFYATMMNKDEKGFKKNYSIAFKYKGKILGLFLMSLFIATLISIIPCLPISIAQMAYSKNIVARLLYDEPAIIPTSGYALMLIACTLCYAIYILFTTTVFSTMLYQFGTIHTEQKERETKE